MAQETDLGLDFVTDNTTYSQLDEHMHRKLGTFSSTLASKLLDLYPRHNDGPYDIERLYTTIATDIAVSGPCDSLAKEFNSGYNGSIWR